MSSILQKELGPELGSLLTPKFSHYLVRANNFGVIFGGHPYRWNKKDCVTELVGRRKQLLWRFNMILGITYVLFVYFRCVQVNLDSTRSNAQKIYMRIMAAYMSLSLIAHISVIQNLGLTDAFSNQYFNFTDTFQRMYSKEDGKTPTMMIIMGLVLQLMYYSINCLTVLMALNSFLRPTSPEQLTSLMDGEPSLEWRTISACFIFYIEYIYHASTLLVMMTFYPALAIFMSMINELSCRHNSMSSVELRTTVNKFRVYRELQIQIMLLNQIYNYSLVPGVKILGIAVVIYCTYAGIKMSGIEAYALGFLGFFMVLLLLATFSFLAEFHLRSTRVLKEWEQQTQWDENYKYIRTSLRTFRPLVANIRDSYYVDRRMVLSLATILVVNTSNFLLVNN
ncbi:unnamed protein product [Allacma fusca]|uniref:Uncharacterized protein n=1 Tax=Allacma fusca TaxID=39272 RepID=A0A8J2P0I2_9HEXA|nr:unnamed protein product [Allacma fusca]